MLPKAPKARRPDSRAYVLSQVMRSTGPAWVIVDRSGASRLVGDAQVRHDETSDDTALEAMRAEAERRQQRAEQINPDSDHALFVAVLADELAEMGVRVIT